MNFKTIRHNAFARLLTLHQDQDFAHLGSCLSCLDALLVLFHSGMRDNDVFVLSKAHAAAALYVGLWSRGEISESTLQTFCQNNTLLPAHPVSKWHEKIWFSGGSLGHGLSLSSGVALADQLQGTDRMVYCLISDGELQEGAVWEALSFISFRQLKNVRLLIDYNGWQAYHPVRHVWSTSDMKKRLTSFGWKVVPVNGHNPKQIYKVLQQKDDRPVAIILNTHKGLGIERLQDTVDSHYLSIRHEETEQIMQKLARYFDQVDQNIPLNNHTHQ